MADLYVGPGGLDANLGTSWAQRYLTLGKAATVVNPGDRVWVGPGTYRELLTLTRSGGNAYAVGTASVQNGSAVVTGVGTSWLTNAYAGGYFIAPIQVNGADGVTNGTTAFGAAGGKFQQGDVGKVIQITTKAWYYITAVNGPTSITLSGSPSAGTGLTYSVMTGVPHIKIASVDSDTQLTLESPWDGATHTELAYNVFRAVEWLGDYDGSHTDGVGGLVRLTGSNDDLLGSRLCFTAASINYQVLSRFQFDLPQSANQITGTSSNWLFEKCVFTEGATGGSYHTQITSTGQNICFNACAFMPATNVAALSFSGTGSTRGHVVQNCYFQCSYGSGMSFSNGSGDTVRNCTFRSCGTAIGVAVATAGMAVVVNNCIIVDGSTGVSGTGCAEDYNSFWGLQTARSSAPVGPNSTTAIPPLFDNRWWFELTK